MAENPPVIYPSGLSEQMDYFKDISDLSPAMLWLTDAAGSCLFVNQRWLKFCGRTLEQELGFGWLENVHPDDCEPAKTAFLEAIEKRAPFSTDCRMRRADGEYRWTIDTGLPRFDLKGKFLGYVGAVFEVHERKLAEQGLKEYAEEIARIAYVASHDLREPARLVHAYGELLKKASLEVLDKQSAGFLDVILDASTRMLALIEDLLYYTNIKNGSAELREVDTESLFTEALMNLGVLIKESDAKVIHDSLPKLSVEKSQFIQVIQNLISNAIKYRREGVVPQICVSCRCTDKEWLFSVKDNGMGIAPQHREKIFQLFERLHSGRQYPGTGIGLAICKKIIERHGGRIWVESELGVGSKFLFTIPRAGDRT